MVRIFGLIFTSLYLLTTFSGATEFTESDIMFEKATQAVKDGRYREAIDVFEVLAENNEADAQYNMALLLKSGRGRPQNYSQALKWG